SRRVRMPGLARLARWGHLSLRVFACSYVFLMNRIVSLSGAKDLPFLVAGRAIYLATTSVISSSGYWWFHCAEILSKVSRKVLLWPGPSGDALKSTTSG